MFPEHRSRFSSWLSGLRGSKQQRKSRCSRGFGRRTSIEDLEQRRLLVSRVFLDFGDGFTSPTNGPYAGWGTMTAIQPGAVYSALTGTGVSGTAGEYFLFTRTGFITPGLTITPPYNFVGASSLLLNGFPPDLTIAYPALPDFVTFELAITAQIQRALEPFDIQVVSSVNPTLANFPIGAGTAGQLSNASALLASNNLPGDGGSPINGTAAFPQGGSDDVYVYFGGFYQTVNPGNLALETPFFPISTTFGVHAPAAAGAKPDRVDGGAMIDVNYFIHRVADPGGTGGSVNVAVGNAALYAIGLGFGLSEVENGQVGPNTNYFNPDVALLNQANAMAEAGYTEGFLFPNGLTNLTINDQYSAFFPRFGMMQDGLNFQPLLRPGTLGNPPVIVPPSFPLPPNPFPQSPIPLDTINSDPNVKVNSYDQLANDPDIGLNPDVQYVSGTGAFDKITITKTSSTLAAVTVKAYSDASFTRLIGSFNYNINLKKTVLPGRLDSGQPFRVIVEGCNSDDQITLDPTLGVNVVVHGGASVKTLNISGTSSYNVRYTPNAPRSLFDSALAAMDLIPETLTPAGAGTFQFTGTAKTLVSGKSKNVAFTTNVSVDHFDTANGSAFRLKNFNKLTYASPGFLDNEILVTDLGSGSWQIAGQVDSPVTAPSLNGNLQFNNITNLAFDTTKGASNDTISFSVGNSTPPGLKNVSIAMGTGIDQLNFDDSASFADQDYLITPTLFLPVQAAISPFQGFKYSGAETLSLSATQGNNNITVTPSATTAIDVNGNDPPSGTLPPDGDRLALHFGGTTGASEFDDGAGTGEWSFANRQSVTFSGIENIVQPTSAILAIGAGANNKPLVKVIDPITGVIQYSFYAYETSFKGGVQVATADFDLDGTPDIVVAPGAGRTGEVRVYSGAALLSLVNGQGFVDDPSGALLAAFNPDGSSYKSGLYIAAGDVDFDGNPDIVTSRARGTSKIRVFANTGGAAFTQFSTWTPFGSSVAGGVVVAAADTDGDGFAEVIAAPAAGATATVKVFSSTGRTLQQIAAFESSFRGGVSLAAGDLDGDGNAEIIVGAGANGGSRVRIFDAATGTLRNEFAAFTTTTYPLRLAAVDPDGAGTKQLFITRAASNSNQEIRLYDGLGGDLVDRLFESTLDFRNGVNLG